MKQAIAGVIVLIIGIAILAYWIRAYRRDFAWSLYRDIADYSKGRVLTVFIGLFVTFVGAYNIWKAIPPGAFQRFSSHFHSAPITPPPANQP